MLCKLPKNALPVFVMRIPEKFWRFSIGLEITGLLRQVYTDKGKISFILYLSWVVEIRPEGYLEGTIAM